MISRMTVVCALVFCSLALPPATLAEHADPLAGQWHLETPEGYFSTHDSSGHLLHGAMQADTAAIPGGRFGGAFNFSNPNSEVQVGASPQLEPARVTAIAWVRAPVNPGPLRIILAKGADGCSAASYSLYNGTAGQPGPRFYVYDGAQGYFSPSAGTGVWDGGWHMVAGVYDGAAVRLFVDGQQVGNGTPAAVNIKYDLPSRNFQIGNYANACPDPDNFGYDIDEVRIYNRALSATEIARLAAHPGPDPPTLVADTPGGGAATERNLTPPRISFVARRGGTGQYRCSQGTWEGLAGDPGFAYSWWRVSEAMFRDRATGILGPRNELAGAGPTFTLPRSDVGQRFYCQVQARGRSGRFLRAYSNTTALTGRPEFDVRLPAEFSVRAFGDVRIRGIDVFQVVQPLSNMPQFAFPSGGFRNYCGGGTPTSYLPPPDCGLNFRDPQRTTYFGVALDQRKPTTAVVYVDMRDINAVAPGVRLNVSLSARVGGKPLSRKLVRTRPNPPLPGTPYVTQAERGNADFGVQFDLPAEWLAAAVASGQDTLDLEATVSVPPAAGAGAGLFVECLGAAAAECRHNDRFRLDDVGTVVDDLPELTIKSVALVDGNQALNSPGQVLSKVVELYPGGERLNIQPYSGSVDIHDAVTQNLDDPYCAPYIDLNRDISAMLRSCRQAYVAKLLGDWIARDPKNGQGFDLFAGIHRFPIVDGDNPGWSGGPVMYLNDASGSIGAAHEFGHTLGFPHAGQTCGGNADGQVGEPWPPLKLNNGQLQGVAWQRVRRRRLASPTGTPRVDGTTPETALFDLMSYCKDGGNAWLSARNWQRAFKALLDFGPAHGRSLARVAAPRARAAAAGQAFAAGVVGPAGAKVLSVVPADPDNRPLPDDPASPLRLRAFDASGKVLSEAGVRIEPLLDAVQAGNFRAALPAGTAAVELVSGSTVVDRRERSRPPKVSVVAPKRGARVGRRLGVRWTASDPDGDALTATIEYSSDGGRTWNHVFEGRSTGRATVPGRYLASTSRGRVRVNVNDGFSEARADSARFRVAGSRPTARIAVPAPSQLLPTGRILLIGSAFDDRQRRLRGRSLTWFAGARRLGTGEQLSAKLSPGKVRLRLVARDRRGRAGAAVRRVRIEPVFLQLTTLAVPARVRARARTVPVKIATTVPATIRAGGRRQAVGRRARTLRARLPARPKTGLLKVPVTITARGPKQPPLRTRLLVMRF